MRVRIRTNERIIVASINLLILLCIVAGFILGAKTMHAGQGGHNTLLGTLVFTVFSGAGLLVWRKRNQRARTFALFRGSSSHPDRN